MFKLSIVTPEKIVYEGEVISLIVPGVEGYLGVLSHHAPLITALKTGKIEFQDGAHKLQIYAVSGGFMEVSSNHATLLADTAEHCEEIDVQRAQTALERAQQALNDRSRGGGAMSGTEIFEAFKRAENRLKIHKDTH